MKRRTVCATLGALAAAKTLAAFAQGTRAYRLAWVTIERAGEPSPGLAAFMIGMRELGYREGRDYTVSPWYGEGSAARLEALAPEIVSARPDVIVSQGGLALTPLLRAGVKTPIVFTYSGDPVEAKIVDSFARPGRNLTGISLFTLEIVGKRLEVLRDILPGLKRVAFLANPQHPGEQREFAVAQAAAAQLGMASRYFPVRSEAEMERALADIARGGDEAIVAFADGFTMSFASRIAAFSLQQKVPAIDGWAPFARSGNLAIYGPVLEDCYRRLASYVDRIRKGAKPADLPIELPVKLELVINLKTAKALGLTIPQAVLLRADQLIE
ncbi:MAG: ABC transporter substrate-binding protein [Casimicrobiaceae bacterium]